MKFKIEKRKEQFKVRFVRKFDGTPNELYIDGEPVSHYKIHSPTGMEIGYSGSGPADTAYSILKHLGFSNTFAGEWHQGFKWSFVATWPNNENDVTIDVDIRAWLKGIGRDRGDA